jgi:hypothetical protein
VDCIRDLGWQGVLGNTDKMHSRPESMEKFASQSSAPSALWAAIREVAATRAVRREARIDWLRGLPLVRIQDPIALVHGSPESSWRAAAAEASDAELEPVYRPPGQPIPEMLVVNAGSVSLPYDGDCRAARLLLDGSKPTIRRVEYDVEREIKELGACGLPHSDWMAKVLRSGYSQMP